MTAKERADKYDRQSCVGCIDEDRALFIDAIQAAEEAARLKEQERCVAAVKEWTFGQRKREILKLIREEGAGDDG